MFLFAIEETEMSCPRAAFYWSGRYYLDRMKEINHTELGPVMIRTKRRFDEHSTQIMKVPQARKVVSGVLADSSRHPILETTQWELRR
jgi:hypothetical protein